MFGIVSSTLSETIRDAFQRKCLEAAVSCSLMSVGTLARCLQSVLVAKASPLWNTELEKASHKAENSPETSHKTQFYWMLETPTAHLLRRNELLQLPKTNWLLSVLTFFHPRIQKPQEMYIEATRKSFGAMWAFREVSKCRSHDARRSRETFIYRNYFKTKMENFQSITHSKWLYSDHVRSETTND